MINLLQESVISFAAAARLLPSGRGNRPVHPSTIYRWARPGLRGVKLEVVRLGGRWLTSREAIKRFADRLTADHDNPDTTAASQDQSLIQVEDQLNKLGLSIKDPVNA